MSIRGVANNTAANLMRGASGLVYTAAVPAIIVRGLGREEFATWSIVFQISLYVAALELGARIAVARFTAAARARNGEDNLPSIMTSGLLVECTLGCVATVAATAVVTFLPLVQANVATTVVLVMTVVLCGTAAMGLVSSIFEGWFIGHGVSRVPAIHLTVGRAISVLAAVATFRRGLLAVTLALSLPVAGTAISLAIGFFRRRGRLAKPSWLGLRQLTDFMAPLAAWSLAMVVIGGVDIFVVRAVDPAKLADYALALSATNMIAGVVGAAATAWLPMATGRAVGTGPEFSVLVTTSVTATVHLLGLIVIPLIALADVGIGIWAGPGDWTTASSVVRVLAVAQLVRLSLQMFTSALLATGEHSVYLSPALEAIVNLVASIFLGALFGAVGVAWGTLMGAVVGSSIHVLRTSNHAPKVGLGTIALARAVLRDPLGTLLGVCAAIIAVVLPLEAPLRAAVACAAAIPAARALLPYAKRLAPTGRPIA